MAFATVTGRAAALWAAATASGAVTLPPGIVAGERLLVAWVSRTNVGPPTDAIISAGWTQIGAVNTQSACTSALFTKIAAGGDTLTVTSTLNGGKGSTVAFRIANAGTVTAASSKSSSLAADPPSHSVGAAADTLWVAVGTGYRSSGTVWVATAAPTEFRGPHNPTPNRARQHRGYRDRFSGAIGERGQSRPGGVHYQRGHRGVNGVDYRRALRGWGGPHGQTQGVRGRVVATETGESVERVGVG